MKITRREFLSNMAGLGVMMSGIMSLVGNAWGKVGAMIEASALPDLAIATGSRGENPEHSVRAAIKAIGGISQFVKEGDVVVIKPNIGFSRAPETAVTTNPVVVSTLIKLCYEAKAKDVLVFDHTCDYWEICFKRSGIKQATLVAGGKIFSAHRKGLYRKVSIPAGKTLKETLVVKHLLDADVIINVPIAKHHGAAELTMGMKNLMGAVWDRGIFHVKDLHQCIADLSTVIKPHLTVLDATRILFNNGPRGPGEVKNIGKIVVGVDPVAVDAYGCSFFGKEPHRIGYINIAYKMGLGEIDLNKIRVKKVSL
ncbi:DUF362 domain-containing protein [Candidatus Desantisbacteria bacterium]|nr:DUF362 domain-containing protein [Candidatus Desantisbacteria bacterium]